MENYLKIQAFIFLVICGERLYASQPYKIENNVDDLSYNFATCCVEQSKAQEAKLTIQTDFSDSDEKSLPCLLPCHKKPSHLVELQKFNVCYKNPVRLAWPIDNKNLLPAHNKVTSDFIGIAGLDQDDDNLRIEKDMKLEDVDDL